MKEVKVVFPDNQIGKNNHCFDKKWSQIGEIMNKDWKPCWCSCWTLLKEIDFDTCYITENLTFFSFLSILTFWGSYVYKVSRSLTNDHQSYVEKIP